MSDIRKRAIAGLKAGDSFTLARTFTEDETLSFGEISRDQNPVHYSDEFAQAKNLQGKICALSIAQLLTDNEPSASTLANTCYSYITEETAISVVGVYRNDEGVLSSVPGAGGVSPLAASADIRSAEAIQAEQWFRTITAEAFG